jgi:putative ABC transport system substrate-binding protein
MPLDVQMAYVEQLRPSLKNLGILVDNNNVSAVETQSKPMLEYAKARGVRVMELGVVNSQNAQAELAKLVPEAVRSMQKNDFDLQNSMFWITGSTSVFKEIKTINANAFRVPVISAVPEVVGPGDDSAVLSIGISFESNSHLSAVYAAEILLQGKKAGALKVGVVSPPDIAINFRKAREIGMRIPFSFFESATTIYDYDGKRVRPEEKKST